MYIQGLVTLTGAAQSLSTATGTVGFSGKTTLQGVSVREITLQPDSTNSNVVKVGDSNISSTLFSLQLPIPVATIPPPPYTMGPYGGNAVGLDEIYVLGTLNELLHVGILI